MPATPFKATRLIGGVAAAGITVVSWITPALSDSAAAATTVAHSHHTNHAATSRIHSVRTRDAGDTFVSQAHPAALHAGSTKLAASNSRHNRRITFLRFDVSSVPAGATVTHAKLVLTPKQHVVKSRLNLHKVRANWSPSTLTMKDAPRLGHRVATAHLRRGVHKLSFHLRSVVRKNGTYAFALTSTSKRHAVHFYSRESQWAPVLTLTISQPVLTGTPAPVTTDPTPPTTDPTPPTTDPTPPSQPSGCSLSAELVPSCGALFGGQMTSFGGSSVAAQYDAVESDANVTLDVAHDYRRPGQVLTPSDVQLAKAPNTLLQLNWKPTLTWADAGGSNATVNSQIDAMANSIKSLGSTKIMLTLWHEAEPAVSGGAANCPSTLYKGNAGTPADYRAMWANVESRFNALGVTNVVWSMNYLGFATKWTCMDNDMWPGNNLVDWILWDPYAYNNQNFTGSVTPFYTWLTNNSNSTHDYLSKAWGLGEFGSQSSVLADQQDYFTSVKTAIDANTFPRLKLYSVYDADCPIGDFRINRNLDSSMDSTKLADFQKLAADPAFAQGLDSIQNG